MQLASVDHRERIGIIGAGCAGLTRRKSCAPWATAPSQMCPEGQVSANWHPMTDVTGNARIIIQFPASVCRGCQRQMDCTKAKAGARSMTIGPREQRIALQAAREQQQTATFREQYKRRAGVEGSFTQGNLRCDLRHARYIGLAKVHLQHLVTAVAINLIRAMTWLSGSPRAETRTSAFASSMAGTS